MFEMIFYKYLKINNLNSHFYLKKNINYIETMNNNCTVISQKIL